MQKSKNYGKIESRNQAKMQKVEERKMEDQKKKQEKKEPQNGLYDKEDLDILKAVINRFPNSQEISMAPLFPVADYLRNHV